VPAGTTLEAVNTGVMKADGDDPAEEAEKELVTKLTTEYQVARDFDKSARERYGKDRRYAAGTQELAWASDANLIGAFIDILVSFLFAKNPDVKVKPAERVQKKTPLSQIQPALPMIPGLGDMMGGAPGLPVDPMAPPGPAAAAPGVPPMMPPMGSPLAPAQSQEDLDASAFADTLTLVISRLWKDARLKQPAKKQVRSSLSVGPGWFKALAWSEMKQNPQVARQLQDAKQSLEQIEAKRAEIAEAEFEDTYGCKIAELNQIMQGAGPNLERQVRAGLNVDFVRAENIQVSLDISDITEYLKAGWVSEDLYVPKASLRERFPRLTAADVKQASCYFQKLNGVDDRSPGEGSSDALAEGQFTKTSPGNTVGGSKPVEFAKVVEFWDKRDGLIKTFVEGIKRWAVEPYPPPQVTTRFYPWFLLALFEVDGARHPQSLAWRLRKLQDEYSAARSNQRLTRERSIPGTVFKKNQMQPESVRALENSVHLEMVGIDTVDQNADIRTVLMEKPIPKVDPAIFNTAPIQQDMQYLSGVQEALSSGSVTDKTATEANIEQQGFASRTGADRDTVEDVYRDLAQYTAEVAIQDIRPEMAQRIAGSAAFWPYGMDVQDILYMMEVEIDAGSTGKPNTDAMREAWGVILPQLKEVILEIRQYEAVDPALAEALRNLLRETLRRLDDRLDVDMFIASGAVPPEALAVLASRPTEGQQGRPGASGTPGKPQITPSAGAPPGVASPASPV
jgi:hypothetical protein